MKDAERAAAVALATCPGLEPATLRQLVRGMGSALAVWEGGPAAWRRACRMQASTMERLDRWRRRTDPARMEVDLARRGIRSAVAGDEMYPTSLLDLSDPPVVLFLAGREDLVSAGPMVSVVGTRRASAYGAEAAAWIAETLAKAGVTVVSGLALGIDAAAHQACLQAGGATVAVLATGVDRCYPPSNRPLYHLIRERGLLISEYAPGTPVARYRFPERNRMIAALGRLTIVAQAGIKSGALRTADNALDLGRDVYAVPGPITTVHFQGCHRIIQEGAGLLADPRDVLAALGLSVPEVTEARPVPARWQALYDALVIDLSAGALALALGMEPARVYAGLLELELAGCVQRLPGGVYRRIR